MATKKPTTKSKVPPRPKPQDFESVARRLECDEDKDRFEQALGKIARTAPKTKNKA